MSIDTSSTKHWTPFRMLALLGLWLAALATLAFVADGCGSRRPPPPMTDGSITLTWSIFGQDHQPTTCAGVSARVVALQLHNRATGAIVSTTFACPASPGTAQMPAGAYDIDIALRDAGGRTLATAAAQMGVVVTANQITRLTPVTFIVNTQGGLAISLEAESRLSNCRKVLSDGAGISGNTLALERIEPGPARCEQVTFVRTIGAQEVGTYVANDCSAPPVSTCIERTETLTASLPAGTYVINVVGKIATSDCWKGDAKLMITAGETLTTVVKLARQPC